jgi:hypothetical protein
MAADHDVLQRAHVAERPDVLEGPRDAARRRLLRRIRLERRAGEGEAAAVRHVSPVRQLKKVVLPAPFGPINP